jgi:RNA polymerase sigma factor (sigma-70 family)
VLTGDSEAAQDLVQSVLLRMLHNEGTFVDSPVAYARRGIVNLYLDEKRRQKRFGHVLGRLKAVAPRDELDSVELAEDRRALRKMLAVLTPRERAAIVLRYYADQDDRTIADYLGCSPTTVRSLVHRGLPKLRAHPIASRRVLPDDGTRRDER